MTKLLWLIPCAAILWLWPTGLRASDRIDPQHWPIKKGQYSPLDGQCMTTERAIYLGNKAAACDDLLQIELERCQARASNDLELMRRHKNIDTQLQRETVTLLRKRLEQSQAWHRSPEFVATVAVVVTIGVMLGARAMVVGLQ